MIVLSSAKIKTSIQMTLQQKYPTIDFQFCNNMGEAETYLQDATVLISYGEDLNDELIEKAKKLKWIMVISAGLDQMPFKALEQRNILITNARGIHATPMAEYVIAMMLQVSRNNKLLIKHEQEQTWDRTVKMEEITEKTIAIIGAGAIGQEIARLAQAFRMKTIGVNTSGELRPNFNVMYRVDEMTAAFVEADFVVNVLPSTNDTYKMINNKYFSNMKKSAVFINIGRGTTVDEDDLIKSLHHGDFAHAVLDVFHQEPLPSTSPFWEMENVTVTPHLSGISRKYQERAFTIFEENLHVFLEGKTTYLNKIDPKRGY